MLENIEIVTQILLYKFIQINRIVTDKRKYIIKRLNPDFLTFFKWYESREFSYVLTFIDIVREGGGSVVFW